MGSFKSCSTVVMLLILAEAVVGYYSPSTECESCECICNRWCNLSNNHGYYDPSTAFGCTSCDCMCNHWCGATNYGDPKESPSESPEAKVSKSPRERPTKTPRPRPSSSSKPAPSNIPSPRPSRIPRALPSRSPRAAPSKSPRARPSEKGDEPSPKHPSGTGQCESCSKENFRMVNQYRGSMGAGNLKWNDDLESKAKAHSKWMFEKKLLEHSSYGGWENIAYRGGSWDGLGEAFFEQWKASPGHNSNMLVESHTCGGVGIYGDGHTYYATQIFMSSC